MAFRGINPEVQPIILRWRLPRQVLARLIVDIVDLTSQLPESLPPHIYGLSFTIEIRDAIEQRCRYVFQLRFEGDDRDYCIVTA